ncbi:chloramphenicol 3-O phosphotransferase [Kribbella amoyensis]|uniref:Chloramphenicol 3-O phosphotransferase n=1 Tax=Kribbella amoyensis TaxID=996641 RepID=A0A561B3J8_9ACTN|nr:AAA family ATPase [Kribbella amoyensis]TWD73448.1 chloramphenicol 3-O phosphotransferase [Kribbella amoyensis]
MPIAHELTPEATNPEPGRVILLNGTSSSGKSSIAAELLTTLDGPWYHLAVDHCHRIRSRHPWTENEFLPIFQRTLLGFHRMVAGMAAAGNDVVVDHILSEDWRLTDCLEVFAGLDLYYIGIHCSLPELERREADRGDRTTGLAALQYPLVHRHGVYDLEVDSEKHDPTTCATKIRTRLTQSPPTAFPTLRKSFG